MIRTEARLRVSSQLSHNRVVSLVKRLAKEQRSTALAQLASRIAAVMEFGASAGEDPFVKVRGLISGLIAKLEQEAAAEATEKAYCDEQMTKTEAKKAEKEEDVEKLTTKMDQAAAKTASLKADVKALQEELAALAKSQAEMDQARAESKADYTQAKEDLEEGLTGVRSALGVLRDYYGGSASAAMLQEGSQMQQPAAPESH